MRPLRVGDLIAREMEALIKNGFWSPGDILPFERELAQRFGVSRGSVREALRLLGAKGLRSKRSSPWSIPCAHRLSSCTPELGWPFDRTLIVQGSLSTANAILAESTLSFLGLGIQPPTPSWGSMLNEARGYVESAPWLAIFPSLAIFIAVLSFNLLGDALRDAFDPRTGRG